MGLSNKSEKNRFRWHDESASTPTAIIRHGSLPGTSHPGQRIIPSASSSQGTINAEPSADSAIANPEKAPIWGLS